MSRRWNSRIPAAAVGAALAVALPGTAAADVVNGGFESPAVSGVALRTAPETFGGWTVDAGQLSQAGAASWAPATGAQSILLNGDIAALTSLSQAVAVQPGARYRLSLRHSDGPLAGGACGAMPGMVMPLQVEFDGANVATIPWSGGRLTNDWQQFRTLVTAAGASAVLRLKSERGELAHCGMTVDDVALTAPAPDETAVRFSAQPAGGRSVVGQPVELTAAVIAGSATATPTGAVQFRVDGAAAGAPVPLDANGAARLTLTSMAAGTHAVTATYQPSGGFQSSPPQSFTQVVDPSETTVSVDVHHDPAVAGRDIVATVTVRPRPPGAGTPTGQVIISDDVLGGSGEFELEDDGTVTAYWPAYAGAHHISASYRGDASFRRSTTTVTHAVRRARTTTTIQSSRNPVAVGELVEFAVGVESEPGTGLDPYGSLQFTLDGAPFGIPIELDGASGLVVTVRAPTVPVTTTVGVAYSGDEDTEPSSASLTQVVAAPAVTPPSPVKPATPAPPVIVKTTPIDPATTRRRLSTMSAALVKGLQRRGLAAAATLTQSLVAPGAGTLEQRVTTGRKRILLASASRTVTAAGPTSLRLKLTAQGRRMSRRPGKLALTIVTRFRPTDGEQVTLTRRARV